MTAAGGRPSGTAVIVDDRLALFAALGWWPADPAIEIVTTYGWQQRLLGAFVAPRRTEGQLQRLAATLGASAASALDAAGNPDPLLLTIAGPRSAAIDIARMRVTGANPLAAETVAAAKQRSAVVRFSPRNSPGHVVYHVLASGLDFAIWDPVEPTWGLNGSNSTRPGQTMVTVLRDQPADSIPATNSGPVAAWPRSARTPRSEAPATTMLCRVDTGSTVAARAGGTRRSTTRRTRSKRNSVRPCRRRRGRRPEPSRSMLRGR